MRSASTAARAYGDKDAANHDLKHVAAKAPGTYVRGSTEYWQCRDCGKSSPTTFDAGIGVCAVTAFTSLTGLALLRRKRRDEE